MVGTLKLVGEGLWPPARMAEALAACSRAAAGPTAPPDGLTFISVDYEPPIF
jgi:tRNA pseudouridine38-40 synthase